MFTELEKVVEFSDKTETTLLLTSTSELESSQPSHVLMKICFATSMLLFYNPDSSFVNTVGINSTGVCYQNFVLRLLAL